MGKAREMGKRRGGEVYGSGIPYRDRHPFIHLYVSCADDVV